MLTGITLSEFGIIYKNNKQGYITTAGNYERELRLFDYFLDYKIKLNELTQKHVDDYVSYLFKKGKKHLTIIGKIKLITTAIRYAKRINILPKEFEITAPKINVPQVERKFIIKEDMVKILKNCKNQNLYDIVATAFFTGMRQGELINLQWEQVNFDKRIFSLNNINHITKSRKMRNIPLNSDDAKFRRDVRNGIREEKGFRMK
jgi:integrase